MKEEKIIYRTSGGWRGILEPRRFTSLTLTNKRLVLKEADISISLKDIKNINIETFTANMPCIVVNYGEKSEKIRFNRTTAGSVFHTLFGSIDKVAAETASYTAYWASLITIAKFLYGNPHQLEN